MNQCRFHRGPRGWRPTSVDRASRSLVVRAALLGSIVQQATAFQVERTFYDPANDALIRRADAGDDGAYDPHEHPKAELTTIQIGQWAPRVPHENLFDGRFFESGGFVRLNLTLRGLFNPPGRVSEPFNPYEYGPNPVLGFAEIDVDANVWTGGELHLPMYRYLGAAARFGGMPAEVRFHDRIATRFSDFSLPFRVPPLTRRHGEEFHLDLVGEFLKEAIISHVIGDEDGTFERGETWRITAPLFHRAHGYEPFSLASGCGRGGQYSPPDVQTQFEHNAREDVTTISVVFPLTNEASAAARGEDETQPNNGNACDQSSILEGLVDLQESAWYLREHPSGKPEEDIILEWADQNPRAYLDPQNWTLTVTLGVPYSRLHFDGLGMVFTDLHPNVLPGDVDGDGSVDDGDRQAIIQFLREHGRDGRFLIGDFSLDFSLFDTNYDGQVDAFDVNHRPRPGDGDGDDDVDLGDVALFWRCFGESESLPPPCQQMDFNLDEQIDLRDYRRLVEVLRGPDRR